VQYDGVAYDLTGPNGRRATLYAIKVKVEGQLGESPPMRPAVTQGVAVSAWQSGQVVYVLVVDGGTQEYRHFLRRLGGPLV